MDFCPVVFLSKGFTDDFQLLNDVGMLMQNSYNRICDDNIVEFTDEDGVTLDMPIVESDEITKVTYTV